jgi:thioredoxin 1
MSSPKVIHATTTDFDQIVLSSKEPVLVDFWAPWCGPCRSIAPVLDQLAEQYSGKAKVVKVDIEAHPQIGMRYNVRSIPMLVMFKDGQPAATQVGAPPNVAGVLGGMIDKAIA